MPIRFMYGFWLILVQEPEKLSRIKSGRRHNHHQHKRRSGDHPDEEVRDRLRRYGAFFRFLLENPDYLGRLVAAAPATKANEFLGRAALSLFSFGMGDREENLLLMLFETALEEEVVGQWMRDLPEKFFRVF